MNANRFCKEVLAIICPQDALHNKNNVTNQIINTHNEKNISIYIYAFLPFDGNCIFWK